MNLRGRWIGAAIALGGMLLMGCSRPTAAPAAPGPPRAGEFAPDRWGRYHSKRFQLSLPLPDGKSWRIDDRSRPALEAIHPGTSSHLWLVQTREDELMNRHRCAARAEALGYVPARPLTTVEESVITGPAAYDSRIWIAIDVADGLEGHAFLFGSFLRQCLIVHIVTKVPSAKDEAVLSARLAVLETGVLRRIEVAPLRTTTQATVPREDPRPPQHLR